MSINIISIVSIIIWIVLITELIKPSKEQNGRKIVMLLTAGSASTLILTVSFLQNLIFLNCSILVLLLSLLANTFIVLIVFCLIPTMLFCYYPISKALLLLQRITIYNVSVL